MLIINNITFNFGGIIAVNNVSFNIKKGTITGLIGPNGAGKTTLFNIIAGIHRPSNGQIILDRENIIGLKPHQLFNKGLLRTFQVAHEFSSLTVRENLMLVPGHQIGETLFNTWFYRNRILSQEKNIYDKASKVIDFFDLNHLANEPAQNLSGGQKKLLELGRTMMVEAKVVLLDEIGAGINPSMLNKVAESIKRLNTEHGYTFCMIEHNINFISKLCETVIVMSEGKILMQGTPREVKSDQTVIEAYLGKTLKN